MKFAICNRFAPFVASSYYKFIIASKTIIFNTNLFGVELYQVIIEKKNQNLNDIIKDMKNDYEVINQKYYGMKRENERIKNDIENSKEENYFYKNRDKEIEIHNRKVNYNEPPVQYKKPIRRPQPIDDEEEEEDTKPRYSNRAKQTTSRSNTVSNPIVELKQQIAIHKNNISQLLYDKSQLENELFKIPQTQKTLKDKKAEVMLEDKIDKIEVEININKRKIRELTKELNEQ